MLMAGARFVEGEQPPPAPHGLYGVPAHKNCTCQYIRYNIMLHESGGSILCEDGGELCISSELVPVYWLDGVTDIPDYKG